MMAALPVYHLITRPQDYSDCLAYATSNQLVNGHWSRWVENWEGAFVYDGKVYDLTHTDVTATAGADACRGEAGAVLAHQQEQEHAADQPE